MKKNATSSLRTSIMNPLEHENWKAVTQLAERARPCLEGPAVAAAVLLAVLSSLSLVFVAEALALLLLASAAVLLVAAACAFLAGLAFLIVHPAGNLILLASLLVLKLLTTSTSPAEPASGPTFSFQELS